MMHARRLAAAVGVASLFTVMTATAATAGTHPSGWCNDGTADNEIPILASPVNVAIEIGGGSGGTYQSLRICYSTSPRDEHGAVTAGSIGVTVDLDAGTAEPGGYVRLVCNPDDGIAVGPTCETTNSVHGNPDDVGVAETCLVSIGSGCLATLPVRVDLDRDSTPLLRIDVLGMPIGVDSPVRCIEIGGVC